VPDETTYADVYTILQERGLWRKVPSCVRKRIQKGKEDKLPETPKGSSRIFKRVHNVLIGTNKESCQAAAEVLEKRGYHSLILSTRLQGEAREVGKILAGICIGIHENHLPVAPPAAVVAGGETTVTVHGKGRGGRNQELVLSAALSIRGDPAILVSSIGTDGVDGSTDAAGAVADGNTVDRSLRIHMDPDSYLRENNSYPFFERLSDLVITGPTGTNVNDIFIGIVGPGSQKNDTARRSRGK
jgi:glycerate-2-kinase